MAKILVAGSDGAEREACAVVIEFGGHRCATAGSLDEAVKTLQQDCFDLVVADSQLGRSPGEIITSLKRAAPQTAVLVMQEKDTTVPETDAVLTIPCSDKDLFQRIESLVHKSRSPARLVPAIRGIARKYRLREIA